MELFNSLTRNNVFWDWVYSYGLGDADPFLLQQLMVLFRTMLMSISMMKENLAEIGVEAQSRGFGKVHAQFDQRSQTGSQLDYV